ncbi:MAG: hypothetical protein NC097_03145 [Clostridium sp.]|nr:hypothetical protein [Prevotella sp.]MCM1428772.1 hypothetical protein [Clostridium sp.]MCM1475147.1 hypothetical protein [Muribaculaceae bacterium]
MANKRTFKKVVDILGADLCENMMISFVNLEGVDKAKVSEAIGKVLDATEEARLHSNVFFDKGVKAFPSKKEYSTEKKKFFKALYNKIEKDFNEKISEALKLYNSAIPESVKQEQKAAVN